jgi:hypothetical protein
VILPYPSTKLRISIEVDEIGIVCDFISFFVGNLNEKKRKDQIIPRLNSEIVRKLHVFSVLYSFYCQFWSFLPNSLYLYLHKSLHNTSQCRKTPCKLFFSSRHIHQNVRPVLVFFSSCTFHVLKFCA